jgi:hypothetical protein
MRHRTLIALFLLLPAAAGAQESKSYTVFPTGQGDPEAITCRLPQPIRDWRLRGPEVCKKNAVWAQYRRDGMDVAPDGVHDVPLRNKSGIDCRATATPGGANWTTRMNVNCD